MSAVWPLTGGKRTWRLRGPTSEIDPFQKWGSSREQTAMFYLTGWLRSVLSTSVTTQGVERAFDGGAGDIPTTIAVRHAPPHTRLRLSSTR